MLSIISPAKKIVANQNTQIDNPTQPVFMQHAQELVTIMQGKSIADLQQLMDISHDLAALNYQRYQHFNTDEQTYPALFLFQGDVYQGLEAKNWSKEDLAYAQKHLAILSGLYGLLKPLDGIKPYRLEMGVHLANPAGTTLYAFWQQILTDCLNKHLAQEKHPILINLASQEYFKAVDTKKLAYPVITINFYEHKNNQIKMIGIYAKKSARLDG